MEANNIYKDIAQRSAGNIYIGVVGPVRSGKSTFIKRFMETLVLPNMEDRFLAERATDELPQSAAGRTIMTTEPKFIPENAVDINIDETASMKVRMIDCVGYIIPSALGYIEDNAPRMVKTPWFEEEIPFNMAAELGTRKVINEHSTVGVVITTDGSITDIPAEEYDEACARVVEEMQQINKPFIVLLNCVDPTAPLSLDYAQALSQSYGVPVVPVNCESITEEEIKQLLAMILLRFPVRSIALKLPRWVCSLEKEHQLRKELFTVLQEGAMQIGCVGETEKMIAVLNDCPSVESARITSIELGSGKISVDVRLREELMYKVISEKTGFEISNERSLIEKLIELAEIKRRYDKIKSALDEVEATGYGIVMPSLDELSLEEPELMRQGGRYGVRLRASAPSIHMLRADITTEVAPVVGSEKQSEELVSYLLKGFEEDPASIWDSNIFGKSLHELVNEGLRGKLSKMPPEARAKLQETIERVINEGCGGLICIIL